MGSQVFPHLVACPVQVLQNHLEGPGLPESGSRDTPSRPGRWASLDLGVSSEAPDSKAGKKTQPLKLFTHDKLSVQASTRIPHMPTVAPSVRTKGMAEARQGESAGWRGAAPRKGERVRGSRRVEGVSRRPSRSPALLARSLAGVCRSARGAGRTGMTAQPERVGEGAG